MLEAPVTGADAVATAEQPSQPNTSETPRTGRARPSDFTPDYAGGDLEQSQQDPSRIEKRPAGEQADPDAFNEDLPEETVDPEAEPVSEDAEQQQFLSKLAEQLKEGAISLADFEGLEVIVPTPHGDVRTSLTDLVQGNLRQADYTRKLMAAEKVRDEGHRILQLEGRRRQEWQNERALVRDLTRMGLGDSFQRAVDFHVAETVKFRSLPPHEQQRIRLEQQLAAQKEMFEQERQQLLAQQRGNEPTQDQVTGHFRNQLAQLMPQAWKQHQLPQYPYARQLFLQNLQTLYDGGQVTAALVNDAARATAEMLEETRQDLRTKHAEAQKVQARAAPLPPRRLPGGGGQGYAQTNGQRRARPSSFGSRFNGSGY